MKGFVPMPSWLLPRSDVSWAAKALFAVLERHTARGRREAHPSVAELCQAMGSPRRSVERWLFELESAGLVERRRTGRECIYRLAGEPEAPPAISGGSDAPESADRDAPEMADQMRHVLPESARSGGSDAPGLAHQAPPVPLSVAVEDQKILASLGSRGREPPPLELIEHLHRESRRCVGRAWFGIGGIVQAWHGGGMRAVHADVEKVQRVIAVVLDPALTGGLDAQTALTRSIEGYSRTTDPVVVRSSRSFALYASDPARWISHAVALSSAPSNFDHVDGSRIPDFMDPEEWKAIDDAANG